MDDLRVGCPWDKEQTFESLRHLTIEEVYELSDSILNKDIDGIKGELGDLMLHLVFYAGEVLQNWEKLKMKEGRKSVLEGVPVSLPPLVKAYRIQEKAKGVGFEWEKREDVWDKVLEEMNELQSEINNGADHSKMEDEFGDLLFALTNYARYIGINPEDALERTNKKFIQRFQFIEQESVKDGYRIEDLSLDEMEEYWQKAKNKE